MFISVWRHILDAMALDGKSLVGGILILIGIVGTLIGLYVLLPIGGLTVGVITNTATSGAVNVSSQMQTALSGYETSYIADTNAVTNNTAVIIGLVAIVVIIVVFGLKDFLKDLFKGFGSMGRGGVN